MISRFAHHATANVTKGGIVPQKLDKGKTTMTDINEENKDLIENTTPFGLLNHETQERMKAWPHGFEVWVAGRKDHEAVAGGWASVFEHNDYSHFDDNANCVFRAMDAPEPEPEPSKVLHEVCITVESALLNKEMHFKLSFDADLKNPTIEAIE
jgi:hypothetical protein